MAGDARARARAQRATARAVKERRRQLPQRVTQRATETRRAYLERMLANPSQRPEPDRNNPLSRSLAREAGKASWHKADERYLDFSNHWYHKKRDEDDEEIDDYFSRDYDNGEEEE